MLWISVVAGLALAAEPAPVMSGLLQAWYLASSPADTEQAMWDNTFKLRRAELRLKGDASDHIGYELMLDASKALGDGDVAALQDFGITYRLPGVDVTVGQSKIPVSMEALTSSSKLLLPERSVVTKTFGDKRDLGVKATVKREHFTALVGLYNGAGLNTLDTNPAKDLGVRLEGYPAEGVTVAAVAYTTLWRREDDGATDRFEADLRLGAGAAQVQGEYIFANASPVGGGTPTQGQGFYVAPSWTLQEAVTPVVRVGYLDVDIDNDQAADSGDDERWVVEGGLNWALAPKAKLQGAYAYTIYQEAAAASVATIAAQVNF